MTEEFIKCWNMKPIYKRCFSYEQYYSSNIHYEYVTYDLSKITGHTKCKSCGINIPDDWKACTLHSCLFCHEEITHEKLCKKHSEHKCGCCTSIEVIDSTKYKLCKHPECNEITQNIKYDGYCIRHEIEHKILQKCIYEGCNTIIEMEVMACSKHRCEYQYHDDVCPNVIFNGQKYCVNHCIENCLIHKCLSCDEYITRKYTYCDNHGCPHVSINGNKCKHKILRGRKYCLAHEFPQLGEHICHYEDNDNICETIAVEDKKFCGEHGCPKCDIRKDKCEKHICHHIMYNDFYNDTGKKCMNEILDDGLWCNEHKSKHCKVCQKIIKKNNCTYCSHNEGGCRCCGQLVDVRKWCIKHCDLYCATYEITGIECQEDSI